MLILDSNKHMIKSTKKMSTSEFNMKILGVVDVTPEIKHLEHIMDWYCLEESSHFSLNVIITLSNTNKDKKVKEYIN